MIFFYKISKLGITMYLHLNWAICFNTKKVLKQDMIVFHLHSSIYYLKVKNVVIKFNASNPPHLSSLLQSMFGPHRCVWKVSTECLWCVEAKKISFFWTPLQHVSYECRTSVGHWSRLTLEVSFLQKVPNCLEFWYCWSLMWY